ncbi:hypothetical protein DK853_34320, partial [Klebsiella oxytoca]
SAAVPVKSLAVFLFPALLLYREKNVFRIGMHTAALFLPWFLLRLLFPMGDGNGGNLENILVIFGQKLVFRKLEIPVFLLAVIVLY